MAHRSTTERVLNGPWRAAEETVELSTAADLSYQGWIVRDADGRHVAECESEVNAERVALVPEMAGLLRRIFGGWPEGWEPSLRQLVRKLDEIDRK